MADQLKDELDVDCELVVGEPGEFTVWFAGEQVAQKDRGQFPAPADVISAVRDALARSL